MSIPTLAVLQSAVGRLYGRFHSEVSTSWFDSDDTLCPGCAPGWASCVWVLSWLQSLVPLVRLLQTRASCRILMQALRLSLDSAATLSAADARGTGERWRRLGCAGQRSVWVAESGAYQAYSAISGSLFVWCISGLQRHKWLSVCLVYIRLTAP